MASKDLVRRTSTALGTTDDGKTLGQDVGGAMVLAGGGGLALMFGASLIPFVGPMLFMILFVAMGAGLYVMGGTKK